jgi:hypothetical protein
MIVSLVDCMETMVCERRAEVLKNPLRIPETVEFAS